jgi:hypothetical protein
MARSEFFKPAGLPGEKPVPSILVDAEKLYGLLLRAELMMNAVNRRRYADRAIVQIQDVIAEFVLAYDFEDDRLYHLKRMWAKITVFVRTMRAACDKDVNAISIQPKYEKMKPDTMVLEIFNTIASMEEGADAWKKSVMKAEKMKRESENKGTTGSRGWNRQTPEE